MLVGANHDIDIHLDDPIDVQLGLKELIELVQGLDAHQCHGVDKGAVSCTGYLKKQIP